MVRPWHLMQQFHKQHATKLFIANLDRQSNSRDVRGDSCTDPRRTKWCWLYRAWRIWKIPKTIDREHRNWREDPSFVSPCRPSAVLLPPPFLSHSSAAAFCNFFLLLISANATNRERDLEVLTSVLYTRHKSLK